MGLNIKIYVSLLYKFDLEIVFDFIRAVFRFISEKSAPPKYMAMLKTTNLNLHFNKVSYKSSLLLCFYCVFMWAVLRLGKVNLFLISLRTLFTCKSKAVKSKPERKTFELRTLREIIRILITQKFHSILSA